MQAELAELCDVLASASRADSKRLKDRIAAIKTELSEQSRELERVDEAIKRR